MNLNRIAIIGFGEVGQAIAKGLSSANGILVEVFDTRFSTDNQSGNLTRLARAEKLKIREKIESIVRSNDIILSAVTCEEALKVAKASLNFLRPGDIFVDLNTVAPHIKVEMSRLVEKCGGNFIEIAILGTIASYGFKSPMLACGKKAPEFAEQLNALGFKIKVLSEKIGTASYMKMLRSVFSKGVESLLFEMLAAAEKCDLLVPVMEAIVDHMDSDSFLNIAETWIVTNVIHAKRRADEMDHVIETLTHLNIQPIMCSATRERLRKCAEVALNNKFKDVKSLNFRDVIKSMLEANYS